jgi:hypothetical protein
MGSPTCVWIIGSVTDLPQDHQNRAYETADALADAFVSRGYRVVMGRSQLLNHLADRIVSDPSDSPTVTTRDIPQVLANRAARPPRSCPNPLIMLGSLRSEKGIREVFMDGGFKFEVQRDWLVG